MSMQVRPGYKLTEVGVIPEDWEAKTIGELIGFSGGSQPPRSTFCFSSRPGFIRLIQIRDYKSDTFETYIPTALAQKTCTAEDIMIGRYGPPIFQILKGIDGAYNVALIKTIPKQKIDNIFWYYFLKQDKLFNFIELLSRRSSGQTGVEMPALKAYGLPLPPLKEQRAIAATLSDIDALISGLDQLIAKKRDIKQAAMQQLLTGQQRLPGFSGEWEVDNLGAAAEFLDGQRRPVKDADRSKMQGEIPYYGASGIVDYVNDYIFNDDLILLGEDGENIISRNVRLAFRISGKTWVNNHAHVLKPKANYEIGYLVEYLESLDYKLYNSGTAQPKLNKQSCLTIQVMRPPIKEQRAIATVLSDMDAELTALESRLDKTLQLKQGMMQELLTGRIRLL